jgi:HSP20 family protein
MAKDLMKKDAGSLSNMFYLSRLDDVFRKFDRVFDDMWGNWGFDMKVFEDLQPKGGFPKMNVIDNDDSYQIDIAVAGFNKEDIKLELKDNALFVAADKEETCESDDCKKYLRKEIASRSF